MKTATFTNFSTEKFVGYWDGKPKSFLPGQSVLMPDYLANHFAKHLTNRELLRDPKNERCTSPKRPADVPEFMELFNKAYQADSEDIDMTEGRDTVDVQMEVVQRSKEKAEVGGLQTPVPPDEDDEEGFPDKPADEPSNMMPASGVNTEAEKV